VRRRRTTQYGAISLTQKKSDCDSRSSFSIHRADHLIPISALMAVIFPPQPCGLPLSSLQLSCKRLSASAGKEGRKSIRQVAVIYRIKAAVIRYPDDIPVEEIVPGDIVSFNAGDVIPGDCWSSKSKMFVDEGVFDRQNLP